MADNQKNGGESLLKGDQEVVGLTDMAADIQFVAGDSDASTKQEETAVEDTVNRLFLCRLHT